MIGSILGNRYEILEIVGSGGMAIVYKARCRLLNRYVAIKMLREERRGDEEFVERFRVEAQAAASLSHHNIVSVFDVGQENGKDYFVMEYIEGVTLKELIQSREIKWQEACEYAMGICDAIEHAHRKNIVHRDIKPHNIMITKEGVVKVTDFGIARAVSASAMMTQGNTLIHGGKDVVGSVHYFSPEQASGKVVDFKSDIYSIGVVLYEMLTGKVPFDADNIVAIARMHVESQPTPVTEIRPNIPEALSDIVMKAMAKQSSSRYQTAVEMGRDLKRVKETPTAVIPKNADDTMEIPVEDIIGEEYIPEEIPAPKKPAPKKSGRGNGIKGAWITAAAVLAVCVAILIFSLASGGPANEIPQLVGQNIDEVMEMYETAEFSIEVEEYEFSDMEEDIIIEQEPSEGKLEGLEVIKVTVSKGRDIGKMPDFEGDDIESVRKILDEGEYTNVTYEYESHSTYPVDTVFRQSPGRGSTINTSTEITIYVSTGKADTKVKVPSIRSLTKENAINTLIAVGLEAGEIQEEYSTLAEGIVISQAISPESEVAEGTKVSFTVSKGPEPEPSPTPDTTPSVTTKPMATPEPDDETEIRNLSQEDEE